MARMSNPWGYEFRPKPIPARLLGLLFKQPLVTLN